jgi:hypothetical protein
VAQKVREKPTIKGGRNMTITKKVHPDDMIKVLGNCYARDNTSAYAHNHNAVSGSILTARRIGDEIEITSGVLTEASITELFDV